MKPKKRNADAIAKAAEEKRRKIEGDHADPAADDGDSKSIVPKLESGANTTIKQELNAFSASSYHSNHAPSQHPYFSGCTPTPALSPFAGYSSFHAATSNDPFRNPQPMWQMPIQTLSDTTPPESSIKTEPHDQSIPSVLPNVSAGLPNEQIKLEHQSYASKRSDPNQDYLLPQQVALQSHQEDPVFQDFCNSELFLPPLEKNPTPPPSPPAQSPSGSLCQPRQMPSKATSVPTPPSPPCPVQYTQTKPECIVIDD